MDTAALRPPEVAGTAGCSLPARSSAASLLRSRSKIFLPLLGVGRSYAQGQVPSQPNRSSIPPRSGSPCGALHLRAVKQLTPCPNIYAGLLHAQEAKRGVRPPSQLAPRRSSAALHAPPVTASGSPWWLPVCGSAQRAGSAGACPARSSGRSPAWGKRAGAVGTGLACHPTQCSERAMLPLHTAGDCFQPSFNNRHLWRPGAP